MKTPLRQLRCLGLAVILLTTTFAQTAPSSSVPSAARNDSPVELSPFVVTTDKDVGYLAANTMSGSRLNTPLIDTPASISEMTKEFLEDIGATEMMHAVDYAMGFQSEQFGGNDNTSQFNSNRSIARGMGRGSASRDFFSWGLSSDTFSVERLSFSRGPNSTLYGIGNPGGIINSVSKRAGFRTRSELNLRTDDNGSWRVHVDHNRRLTDKLALRLNLIQEDQKTWRELEYTRSRRAHVAGTWRPFARTEIRADYERGIQDRLIGLRFSARDYFTEWLAAGSPPYEQAGSYPAGTLTIGNNPRLSYDADAGRWFNYQRYAQTRGRANPGASNVKFTTEQYVPFTATLLGRASTTDNDYWTGTVVLSQEVVRNLFVELAVNRQVDQRTINRAMSQADLSVRMDANRILSDRTVNPRFGQMYLEGQALLSTAGGFNTNRRASVTYEWKPRINWLGQHRWLAMGTDETGRSESGQWNEANLTPLNATLPALSNAQNTVFRRTYVDFHGGTRSFNQDPFRRPNPPTAFVDPVNALAGTISPGFFCSNLSPTRSTNSSLMAAGQSNFWGNRLILTYGIRRDGADRQNVLLSRDVRTQEVTGVIWNPVNHYSGTTRTQGVVIHGTSWFSLYGNRSDNYTPQSGLDVNGDNIGNARGEGYDYGVKFRWGENRLYGRIGRFHTAAENQIGRNFNVLSYTQAIWTAIEGATGEHVTKFTGSPVSNTDSQATEADGYEIEVTANPWKALALTVNYATLRVRATNLFPATHAHVAANRAFWSTKGASITPLGGVGNTVTGALGLIDAELAQTALQEGREAINNYPVTLNTFARYQFQGERLRGVSLGGGARYRAQRVLGYTTAGAPVRAPKWFVLDANLAYRRPLWNKRVEMRVQASVQNVLDNRDLIWTAIDPATYEKNDYSLFTPRLFTLTAGFSF